MKAHIGCSGHSGGWIGCCCPEVVRAYWGRGVWGWHVSGDVYLGVGGTSGGTRGSMVVLMDLSLASRVPPGQGDILPIPPCSAILIREQLLPHGLPGKGHALPG